MPKKELRSLQRAKFLFTKGFKSDIILKGKMVLKKIIMAALSFLFLTSILFSQSLTDLAKRERERRANLKPKKKVVVTNADLSKMKKKTAVSIIGTEIIGQKTTRETKPQAKPRRESASRVETSLRSRAAGEKFYRDRKATFEQKWKKAKEYADMLAMRMNGLWQEFYRMDNMTTRDKIQRDISETFLQMEKVRQEEANAKEELDKFLAQARKEGALPGWLR